ncbi:hypothetical protein SAMN05216388_101585 [Halorientalis persicus]|uniref:Uncharacterized protein n=1 Tax=Halorientalis persicus TaxID=1367881 RepID=A0A1H8R467_9EURY|nr:hypothetical protein [Halorientalis persicus]SEO61489.1 hypothetical protein SAMN05216388_101585 [Halorientalis persicus]
MSRVACCLLVILAVASLLTATAAATPTVATDGQPPGNATETASVDRTVIASDGTFGGFTVGAAILAVVVAGSYRYLRG